MKRVPPVGGDDAGSSEVQINIDFVTTNETTKAIVTALDNKHKVCSKYYFIIHSSTNSAQKIDHLKRTNTNFPFYYTALAFSERHVVYFD